MAAPATWLDPRRADWRYPIAPESPIVTSVRRDVAGSVAQSEREAHPPSLSFCPARMVEGR